MTRAELINQIKTKKTFLCIGLDPDVEKIPQFLLEEEDPIYEFCKQIVDTTAEYCVAYKPNTAFYEAYGLSGIHSLEKIIKYIKLNYPSHFLIADAKRGDIGNTSLMYAKAFFNRLHSDAITVSPYMGKDSITPFLSFEDKWTIILALTSNEGANDFQMQTVNGKLLFQDVIEKTAIWGSENNMMYVVGATKASMLNDIRKIIPSHFLLVPGVGSQGGSLDEVCKYGLHKQDIALLVNVSRSIIYASNSENFAQAAAQEAKIIAMQMQNYL